MVNRLKTIVNPLHNTSYYVDLTNGVSAVKAVLSVFAYVLDIQNVFSMEVQFSEELENRRRQVKLFYDDLIAEPDIEITYTRFPSINEFDAFGKLNYTEVLRYRRLYGELSHTASSKNSAIDREYLESLLLDGANSRLIGDLTRDPSHYRHSVFSFAAAVEELAKAWLASFGADDHKDKTLGQKLASIRESLRTSALYFIDETTLEHLTILLNAVRNDVVHSKSTASRTVELAQLQADLIRQLTQAFGAFVVAALTSFVDKNGQLPHLKRLQPHDIETEAIYFFGLDGDHTGDFLDEAFQDSIDSAAEVIRRSKIISETIHEISHIITEHSSDDSAVLFAEGDNLLFKMKYDHDLLQEIQSIYLEKSGLHCSIGFGRTLHEASMALKLAKAEESGIVGVSGSH